NNNNNNNNNNDPNDPNNTNQDDQGQGNTPVVSITGQLAGAGVIVNAEGVLSLKKNVDRTGKLDRRRRLEVVANLNPDVAKRSKLRKISLNRLEEEVGALIRNGQRPTQDMLYLAGLTKIQYVFYYPETKDIVLAGPAEGYTLDEHGRPMGVFSGDSGLQLEDLVVALRAYGPDGSKAGTVGCSIDPTQEGLTKMQQYLANIGGQISGVGATDEIVRGLKNSLGLQTVTIFGISPNTHFANILVEADYRMKMIGIGLEEPPVRIESYIDRASPSAVSRNAMQRWYFVPDYDCVRVTDDGLAAELVGEGVKLVNADELVRGDGTRVQSANPDRASKRFVDSFTQLYPQLAKRSPVYAQMRDLIDMLIAAAYIQDQGYYEEANWEMAIFRNEELVPVEVYAAAEQVETAVNAVWKGQRLITPVGGGVQIDATRAISASHATPDDGSLAQQRSEVKVELVAGQWWWD
ncbi:MAG: DUF1598 domain-containing protein, partial [Planctomycetales bacterium]|nr:DUF1598 domain-containing protein [Planctomycetales bacterium]